MDRDTPDALWPPPGTVARGAGRGAGAKRRLVAARRAAQPQPALDPSVAAQAGTGSASAGAGSPARGACAPRATRGDDAALWAALWGVVARTVTPLPGRTAPPPLPPAPLPPAPRPAEAAPTAAPPPAQRSSAPAEVAIGFLPAGLDRKRWNGLRRGRLRPERQLDLHGMRLEQAHAAVRRFLLAAQAEGLRCVCVVTGKGSSPEGGALRRELPHWLNAPGLRPLVLAAAHPHGANTGAVHLLLRRRRG